MEKKTTWYILETFVREQAVQQYGLTYIKTEAGKYKIMSEDYEQIEKYLWDVKGFIDGETIEYE